MGLFSLGFEGGGGRGGGGDAEKDPGIICSYFHPSIHRSIWSGQALLRWWFDPMISCLASLSLLRCSALYYSYLFSSASERVKLVGLDPIGLE